MADGDRHGDDDWVLPSAAIANVTLALVGKIGSGKSATANSIIGKKAFPSEFSYSGVTEICEMRSTTFHDGCMARNLHVIDTPGLFDIDNTAENVRNEIINCMEMAKDGIHAMLMVFSAASRFSCEDEKTIESIKLFFGDKILNHMVLVFTHGDVVGEETTWKKKLTDSAPGYLQGMLNLCTNRVVLFNNMTSNKTQRETQLKKLLDAVDSVILRNGGKTFYNQTAHIQEGRREENISVDGYSAEQISRLKEEIYDECLAQMATMVEDPNKTIKRLEKHLLEEQKARQDLKNKTVEEMEKSKEEIQRLREILENAKNESDRGKDEIKKIENRLKTVENYKIIKNAQKESDNAKKVEKSKKQETKK